MIGSLPWVASAVGLGFAYAALPGAVNAEAPRRGVLGGFTRSLLVHTGALIGAAFWAVIALTGTALLARYDGITTLLALAVPVAEQTIDSILPGLELPVLRRGSPRVR